MSKAAKITAKFKASSGKPFPWSDLVAMLTGMGFEMKQGAGSRVKFSKGSIVIKMHKPHPSNEVKAYSVRQVQDILQAKGLL